jgi:hypothetical protein
MYSLWSDKRPQSRSSLYAMLRAACTALIHGKWSSCTKKMGGASIAKGAESSMIPWQRNHNQLLLLCDESVIQDLYRWSFLDRAGMSRKDLEALGSQRESLSINPLLIQVNKNFCDYPQIYGLSLSIAIKFCRQRSVKCAVAVLLCRLKTSRMAWGVCVSMEELVKVF